MWFHKLVLPGTGAGCLEKEIDEKMQKYSQIEMKYLLQFPARPAPFLGLTEKTTYVQLPKKSKYFKADFL